MLSIAVLAGCSSILREVSISDATPEEMRSTLLQSGDLPGWSLEAANSSAGADRVVDRYAQNGEVCDTDGGVQGSYFSFENSDSSVFGIASAAERVCGDIDAFVEHSLSNEGAYSEALAQVLSANLAESGIALQDYKRTQVNSQYGARTIQFLATATLKGPGGSAPYYASEIWVYSDRIITTIYAEGYGEYFPADQLERIVSLTQTRHKSL